MNPLYLNSREINLGPADLIGEGGEAEVFRLDKHSAVKVFKQDSHPDFELQPNMQVMARAKQKERQEKLLKFPKNLPPSLVLPKEFLFDKPSGGEIFAYRMDLIESATPLLSLFNRDFRENSAIGNNQLCEIFTDMYATIRSLHSAGVVVGDLNPLNVLIRGNSSFFIDTDSMQFGTFYCSTYCGRYVDPLLCKTERKQLVLAQPHSSNSDWYSFAVMLFESMLYVHPYGGVYKPKDLALKVAPEERPLRRISVFNPDVQYPSAAIPLDRLPKELRQYFEALFIDGARTPIPPQVLECIQDNRRSKTLVAAAHNPTQSQRAELMITPVFQTGGKLLQVVMHEGKLNFLYWEERNFKRENGTAVMGGDCLKDLHFRLQSGTTVIVRGDSLFILEKDKAPERIRVEQFRGEYPVFDCNSSATFWMDGGKIWRRMHANSLLSEAQRISTELPKAIQDAMPNQTRIFVGQEFGFGFYQAGQLKRSFIFECDGSSRFNLTEQVIPSHLIAAKCYFSAQVFWLFTSSKNQQDLVNTCTVIDRQGKVLASEEKTVSDDGWLARISGKCAISYKQSNDTCSHFLLSTVNGGLAQIGIEAGRFVEVRKNDIPSLSSEDNLVHAEQGLYIWNSNAISLLNTRLQSFC